MPDETPQIPNSAAIREEIQKLLEESQRLREQAAVNEKTAFRLLEAMKQADRKKPGI